MVRRGHGFWLCVVAVSALISTHAVATECVHTPAWDCSDKNPNSCKGTYLGPGAETFIESNSCPHNGAPHELWQVFRYTNLPKGTHYVRTSFAEEDFCIGNSFGETAQVLKREANGCEETGIFQVMQSLDSSCCSSTADYSMGTTWNTDICIAYSSARAYDGSAPPCSPSCFGQDKFFMDPEFLTVLDTNYFGDSDQTNPGIIFSGNVTNTYVSDNTREVLQESGTNHRLFHVYEINKIPEGSSQTLKVEGYRPSNSDGDNFTILFKWNNTSSCSTSGLYQSCGVSINSGSEATYTCNVGNSSGRLCVAIDDNTGGSNNDKVYIDKVWVEVADPVCP
jgi:hypothetical protein